MRFMATLIGYMGYLEWFRLEPGGTIVSILAHKLDLIYEVRNE